MGQPGVTRGSARVHQGVSQGSPGGQSVVSQGSARGQPRVSQDSTRGHWYIFIRPNRPTICCFFTITSLNRLLIYIIYVIYNIYYIYLCIKSILAFELTAYCLPGSYQYVEQEASKSTKPLAPTQSPQTARICTLPCKT